MGRSSQEGRTPDGFTAAHAREYAVEREPARGPYRDGAFVERHPTYAMIGVYHGSSSGAHLFGSDIDRHQHVVSIEITRAERIVDGDHVWYHGSNDEIVRVTMSAAQYAAMIGAPNSGSGVPCTLVTTREGGERVLYAGPPQVTNATLHAKQAVVDSGERVAKRAAAARKNVMEKLGGKVSAKLLREIELELAQVEQEVTSNAPFFVQQLREAADKIVSTAKAEVDAVITAAASRVGFKTLRELSDAANNAERKTLDVGGSDDRG